MHHARAARVAGAIAVAALLIRCAAFTAADTGASGSDGGTIAMVGADAGDAGPAGPFCATRDASFCADFDEDPDAFAGWTSTSIDQNGVLGETTTTFVSSPRALSSRVRADGGQARLAWNYPPTASRTVLSFAAKLTRPPAPARDYAFAVAELDCVDLDQSGNATNWTGVWLGASTDPDSGAPNMYLDPGSSTTSFTLPNLPDRWTQVEIKVDWGAPTRIVVSYDGTTVLDVPDPVSCAKKAQAFLFLGSASDFPNEVDYDNVALEVTP
jgi:hypothetical protein